MLSVLSKQSSGKVVRIACRASTGLGSQNREYSWNNGSHDKQNGWRFLGSIAVAASSCAVGYLAVDKFRLRIAHADAPAKEEKLSPPPRKDLPTFKKEEVKKHGKKADRIWVTYKTGVYDVTNFITSHPGGDKLLLAAGGSVEPYWTLYQQHKNETVMEILEELRIGNLDPSEVEEIKESDASDPYASDPERHPALIVDQQRPFNAETPPSLLMDHFRTPNELFFVRNHMPVPKVIDIKKHRLKVEGLGVKRPLNLSVEELKTKYEPVSITAVVQCSGNRRANMNDYKKVQGLLWAETAISNAEWTGVRLRDLLIQAGVNPNDSRIKHVHLEGADTDGEGQCFGASITFEKAMSPETIVVYSMNGEDLPRDHGYPLRIIAPGIVGARQVKWLKAIRLSDVESPSHWQQKDYRVFPTSVGLHDKLDWTTVHSIQEYPVQSAICIPAPESKVERVKGEVDVEGYAWSGGGRGIIRVEVSGDGGKTWQTAELEQDEKQDLNHMWAWTFFRTSIKIPEGAKKMDLVVKATDRAYNTQPETSVGIWNVRGLINNAWHRVSVEVVD
ncbi:unnamed protein product [Cylicocyclus nassatus]|uniref:Sulfite oxidase n=1 Tax=Cylicocyclus nassatus TaxID=53992 RepID=A0AA36H177_CYLNA|nr:unnamed protein product [Cylicocyclus nassatus]